MPSELGIVRLLSFFFLLSAFNLPGFCGEEKGEIEEIRIIGVRKTEDWVIRKLLTFTEGDQFTDEEGHRSWRRINESRFFRQAGLYPQPGSRKGTVLILIPVTEHKADFKRTFTSGYEPVYGLYGVARAWLINPFGRGRQMIIEASGSEMRFGGGITFTHPWVYRSNVDLTFNLNYHIAEERLFPYEEDEAFQGSYTEKRYSGVVGAKREWTSVFTTSLGVKLEEMFVESTDEYFFDEMEGLYGWARLVILSQEAAFDWRTKETVGWTLIARTRESLSLLGSSTDYLTVSTSLIHGLVLPVDHILSFSVTCEYSFGETLPLHERFHFGKDKSLKGFSARSHDQAGGTRIATLQAVYQTPVLNWWSFWKDHGLLSLFASMGHAWTGSLPTFDEFHMTWGIETGLRFEGYGSVKLEYAENGSMKFQLGIGDPPMFTYFTTSNPGS